MTRTILVCIAGILFCGMSSAFAELSVGDARETVVAELGEPSGYLKAEGYEILYYERGRVMLREGVVSSVHIVSPEELTRQKHLEAVEVQQAALRQEEARQQRMIEGTLRYQQLLEHPSRLAGTAEQRVQTWRSFHARYPEVDVATEYAAALEAYHLELRAREGEQRLAQLEQRVAQAEAQARMAETRALQAEQEARERRRDSYYVGPVVPVYVPSRPQYPCVEPYGVASRTAMGINPMRQDYMTHRRVTSPYSSRTVIPSCSTRSVYRAPYRPVCRPSSGISLSVRF